MARASPHAESSCSPDRKASLLVLGALLSIIGCAPPGEGESALSPGDHAPNHEVDSAPQRIDESPLVALTPTELNNTYRDLLGFPSSPEAWPDPPEIAKAFSASENEVLGVFGNAATRPKVWPWVFPHEAGQQGFEVLARDGYAAALGLPHQRMLLSVARAMGLHTDHAGIEHVQGQTRHLFSCREPLDELTA